MITKYTYTINEFALSSIIRMPQTFTLTGSRAYGGYEPNSDWDYVVNPKVTWHKGEVLTELLTMWGSTTAPEIEEIGESYGNREDMPEMVYLKTRPNAFNSVTKINLIFVHGSEYWAWLATTMTLRGIAQRQDKTARMLQIKPNRVAMFRAVKQTYLDQSYERFGHDEIKIDNACCELRKALTPC